jgi:hypothetical protein
MRAALPALAFAFAFALVAPATQPKVEPPLTKELIESDLKLVAVAPKDRVIEAGTQPYIGLKLVNTSKTRAHKVVKTGDGSECGWREPFVHVTGEHRTVEGKWLALEGHFPGRCGLFDSDWPRDVIELKPGAELALEGAGQRHHELQQPGTIRLIGHYEYRATGGKNGAPRADAERGAMAGVPLFALRTEPVEFTVVRSFDLRAKAKKPLKVGVETKLSEVLEATVTNASAKRIRVGNVSGNDFGLGVSPMSAGVFQWPGKDTPVYSNFKELAAGETVTVFGGGDFASAADSLIKVEKPGTYRVRVSYSIPTNSSLTHVVTTDIELRAE